MNSFIQNTANDYDMSYSDVEFYYDKYFDDDSNIFYEKLEEFIKDRANSA